MDRSGAELGPQTSGGDYEMLAGNLAAIGVGGIVATVSSYVVGRLPSARKSIRYSVVVFGQWPEDFDFEITRAINAPTARHAHGRDSTEGDEDEKKSGGAVETAEIENDDSDLDPVGLQKAFRFAAWSSVALVGSFPRRMETDDL